ncbi:MAG: hypothetical protein U1F57_11015 [bacterium]
MNSSNPPPSANLWIIWGALLASHFVNLAVILIRPDFVQPRNVLFFALAALAVVMGLASLAISQVMTGGAKIRSWAQEYREKGEKREMAKEMMLERLTKTSIFGWALSEAVTIYGLALSFLGQAPRPVFFIFLAGGVLCHLLGWPKVSSVEEALQAEYGGALLM